MVAPWLLTYQLALPAADVTVKRRYEGEGFVIEAAGVGRPKGKGPKFEGIEMWNPDGKFDPNLQAAIDLHLKGTGRNPGPAPEGRKDRFIYTRIFYPPRAGAVYAQPDPTDDAQETTFRSVYCNHELVQVHYPPSAKVGTYTATLYGRPREQGTATLKEGSTTTLGAVKLRIASVTTQTVPNPKLKVTVHVENWKRGNYVALTFLDKAGKPVMDRGEPIRRAIFPRAQGEGSCSVDSDWSAVAAVEFGVIPAITVRFTDVPLDPK